MLSVYRRPKRERAPPKGGGGLEWTRTFIAKRKLGVANIPVVSRKL